MPEEFEIEALSVPTPELPIGPLVIISAELLNQINELGQQVSALTIIHNDIENEAGGTLLKLVTTLEKQVEENATAANMPYNEVTKAITAAKQKASKPLGTFKAQLKAALSGFIVRRENERLAAEKAAADERARAQAEVDEINRSRAAAAAEAGVAAPAPLAVAPAAVMAKPGSAKADAVKVARKSVVIITDPAAVPRAYCLPDQKLVEAAFGRGEITPELHTFFRVEEQVSVSAK